MSTNMKRSGSAAIKSEGIVKTEGGIKKEEPSEKSLSAGPSNGGGRLSASNGRVTSAAASREPSPPPPTEYRELDLLSTSLEDWKYHLMKLASFSKVNPSDTDQFPWPVKLNRKWPPKLKDDLPIEGDPVLDSYGKPIMVPPKKEEETLNGLATSESKKKQPLLWPGPDDDVHNVEELIARLDVPKGPQADTSLIGPSTTANLATRAKGGLFQKRVREVYKASSVARKTHNEEILPWVLEDYDTSKEWESRRKESRKGIKALQLGIKARREGARFPSQSRQPEAVVKKEEDGAEDVKPEKSKANHAPWIGKLEGEAHASASTSSGGAMSHCLFIFDERGAGAFRVVPVSRMYKFLQKPAHANNMSWEEAEKAFERHQKAQAGEGINKFLTRGTDGSAALPRHVRAKDEEEERKFFSSISQNRGLQLPGMASRGDSRLASLYDRDSYARRNKLMAVGGSSARGIRVKDEEGTYGELDFEEDFADDEERNEGDDYAMGEEETKELEQKIKREMAKAEEEENEDDDDDLFDERGRSRARRGEDDVLTGSGKQMKKIMKALARREGNDVYDDDDEDRNPYASEDSSDGGEDSVMANPEEALRRVREEREREAKESAKNGIKTEDASKDTSRAATPSIKTESNTPSTSRTVNMAVSAQQLSRKPGAGHATSAQRATSPNRHGGSGPGSRSGSPDRSRGSSLKRKSEATGQASGSSNNNGIGKRPRTSTQQSSQPSSPRDTSPRSASPARTASFKSSGGAPTIAPPNDLEMEIIRLVLTGKAHSTKELITHFKSRLNSNPTMRENFSKAVTRVLNSNNPQKTLQVRPGLVDEKGETLA